MGHQLGLATLAVAGLLIAGIASLLGFVSVAGLRAQRRKERKGLSNNRLERTRRDDD